MKLKECRNLDKVLKRWRTSEAAVYRWAARGDGVGVGRQRGAASVVVAVARGGVRVMPAWEASASGGC